MSFARSNQDTVMSMPPANLVYLVERAAELKAQGHSWEQVAEKLGHPKKTIEKWKARYRAFWDQAIAIARRDVAADAGDEGLAILRGLAHSANEKIRCDATTRLVALRSDDDASPPAVGDLIRFVEFLESLSDDQLNSLLGPDIRHDDLRPESSPIDGAPPAMSA